MVNNFTNIYKINNLLSPEINKHKKNTTCPYESILYLYFFQLDLAEIKVKYKDLCGKTVSQSIESECSGDYKKMLLAIVGD
jgi:hypothetical protein